MRDFARQNSIVRNLISTFHSNKRIKMPTMEFDEFFESVKEVLEPAECEISGNT